MERKIDRFDRYMSLNGLNDNKVTVQLGLSVGTLGKSRKEGRDLSDATIERILNFYTDIERVWLVTGVGEMLKTPTLDANVRIVDKSIEVTKAPLIGQYAYAGYLSGFADHEYLEAQPIYVASKRYSGGNYVAFEIRGDSMDDNTRRAICHGDVVLAKELKKDYWRSKLHIPKVFVIVHREEGITCKEITEHDVETGDIVCHSWNSTHRDFTLNLRDVAQLFYLKEIKRDVI
ncbi:hypothetical protein LX69_01101 [Breznakibacter xylanolyticus]|uniref:Peptidase S24/S26A/S26B/S26C domain-containing protein n=1 Tax=Breznakibacter xylanolyticus TaxID=990 RepID=A0A2W7NC99_9BACT|nr:S24 family peptidase [Breznakibacter xylanolyticus]PZX18065.1 hypothetical protein LX69_01101 [Breznakibacter xylanolyticus]